MNETGLAAALVPAALVVLMLGLGLALQVSDFGRVLEAPRALAVGLAGQLLLLPALGVLAVQLSGLEPRLAAGVVVLALSPGGVLSNVICSLVRADVALSVSLTAISSLVTPFSIPLLCGWMADAWSLGRLRGQLPLVPTMARLVAVSILPIVAGMAVRRRLGTNAAIAEKSVRLLSTVLFLVVIAVIVAQSLDALRAGFRTLGPTVIGLNLAATAAGAGLARAARLPASAAVTVAIEVGLQNAATGTFVAVALMGDDTMALPSAVYALVALPVAAGMGLLGRRWIVMPARRKAWSVVERPESGSR